MRKDKIEKGEVSRRDFLIGAGAVVVGGAVGAGITYPLVAGKEVEKTTTVEITKTVDVPGPTVTTTVAAETVTTTTTVGAETVTTTIPGPTVTKTVEVGDGVAWPYLEPEESFIGSFSSLFFSLDVKNGRIVRGRPVHYVGPNSQYPDIEPWKLEARGQTLVVPMVSPIPCYGFTYRKRYDSPNRILYPLKRVDWEPGGDPEKINPQNRGISKYKRISWDEAATIIASELVRVADKYGTEALILGFGGHNEKKTIHGTSGAARAPMAYWLFSKYGTFYTDQHGMGASRVGGYLGGRYTLGEDYENKTNLVTSVSENTEMLVAWGADTVCKYFESNIGQVGSMIHRWFGDLGIKRVYITPDLNHGVGIYADKWIPIMPNTDCALMLAIAYTWFTEDTYDKDYVATHVHGFDKWKEYVMGDEDGSKHTPEWASSITGIPEWTIKALAREWIRVVTSLTYTYIGGGISRGRYGHNATRMQDTLMGMQSWGQPGRHIVNGMFDFGRPLKSSSSRHMSPSQRISKRMVEDFGIRLTDTDRDRPFIGRENWIDAILKWPFDYWYCNDAFYKRTYPMEGNSEIHFIWNNCPSQTVGSGDGFLAQKALRSPQIECNVCATIWMEDCTVFADIILPISMQSEVDDNKSSERHDPVWHVFCNLKKCVENLGETKTDFQTVLEVFKKLDPALCKDVFLEGYNSYEEFTEAMLKEAYETSGIQDLISYEELDEKQYIAQTPDPKWRLVKPAMTRFYEDPVKNPLITPTGLIEFESTELLENFPDDKERPPVPKFVRGGPAAEGWFTDEDHILSERAKEYPLLMVSSVRDWQYHSNSSDVPWIREIDRVVGWDGYWYHPCRINPLDAAKRGIENGDIVKIYNDRGGVLAGAVVGERVAPGTLAMDKGGGGDCIIYGELNRGGNNNSICPGDKASVHCQGYFLTGYLVEVEKVTGNQMDEWRKNYPDAFSRDYDPAYGPLFRGWVVKEV